MTIEEKENIYQSILWRDYKGEISLMDELATKYAIEMVGMDPKTMDEPEIFHNFESAFIAGYSSRQEEIDKLTKENGDLSNYFYSTQ